MSKLKLILWKNLVIRKRHWLLTLTEIIIPILLFTLVTYGRSKVKGLSKIEVTEPTYYDVTSLEEIYSHLDVGELNLWYSPFTDFTEKIIKNVQEKLQIPGDAILGFTSKEELLEKLGRNSTSLIAAVNFRVDNFTHLDYDLGIYDKYFKWNTDKLFASTFTAEDEKSGKYLYKGYAALQVAINTAFMKLHSSEDLSKITFSIQEFPDPPKTVDSGLNQLFMYFLPLITIFSFVFLCPAVLQRVGEERHSGTKEFMKMVGMSSWMIWLGWLIHALVTNFLSICVIVILMKVPFWGVSYPLIEHSDGTVLFVFLFLYCIAAITFCFFIGSLFNTPSISTVVGILVWIITYFVPRTFLNCHPNLLRKYKILLTLFPNVALHFGYSSISVYETREVGIQWNNIFKSGSGSDSDVTMGCVLLMLLFEMVFFMMLTSYVERVKPGEYGIARPYFYPFTDLKNFASRLFKDRTKHNSPRIGSENASLNRDVEHGDTPCIHLERLRKKFNNHIAVDDLTMDIRKNQITVLLGHNGAGKTTTMSILTGMINATSGYVTVQGKDIKKKTNEVRRIMGLCPQHNLLFPDLTVLEHLQFFAMLKRAQRPNDSALKMLKVLEIDEKKNDMACTLSGGMKRKLCLGMALIGNSEVLILDEPTSGMDPESRRKIWDLLIQYRKKKTILITTHFMEEADVLGDRIAIMANGRLQCYDTPLNLKIKYNTGYHLSLMVKSKKSLEEITNTVKSHTTEADLLRETDDTLVFVLPLGKNYTGLFKTLEDNKPKWDIVAIGLSLTTLNDVFLKAKDEIDGDGGTEVDGICGEDKIEYPRLMGWSRTFNNYHSLFFKRIYFLKKKYYWFVPPICVTICILLLALWLGMSNEGSQNGEPALKFTLEAYGKPQIYYGGEYSTDPKVANLRNFYRDIVSQQNGKPILREDVSDGIIQAGIENIANYKTHLVVAAEFNKTIDELYVNALYSPNALHGLPISINLAMNAMIKTLLNSSFAISTHNVPLQSLHTGYDPSELSLVNIVSVWLILIPLSFLFLTSCFIIFPHTEVSTNFIQIQAFAGIRTYFYWLSNLCFDIVFSHILMIIIFVAIFVLNLCAFNSKAFQTQEMILLVGILLWYTIMSLPFTYLLSYKRTLSGGFSLLLMVGIFFGFIPTIVVVAMEFSNQNNYIQVAKYLKFAFFVFCPPFTLNYVTVKFAKKYVENFNWKYMDPNKQNFICQTEPNPCCFGEDSIECKTYQNYLLSENSGLLCDLSQMLIPFVLYFLILWTIPTDQFKKCVSFITYFPKSLCKPNCDIGPQNDDEIDNRDTDDTKKTLLVKNLTKSYGPKTIVRNLKLQLKKNSCFGLLGVNGAGKSTTFRMLTKELFFDKGEVTLKCGKQSPIQRPEDCERGEVISKCEECIPIKGSKYCENIGYCPQEDCLNYFLTGHELLYSMALMKGYSKKQANEVTERLLRYFGLYEYKDKPCSEYSGGNKRKLCTCVAFLGYPKVILLDEPTSGVDPASRRNFWNVLSSYKKTKDTSFLLCSHSMEECENLCDEIGIMKDGTIEDSGSLLALKSKYQNGFKVTIKLKYGVDKNIDRIRSKIVSQLNADVIEEYGESLKYQLKDKQATLDHIFETLEKLKEEEESIEDYIISQITLEDIFLDIANKQN